MTSLTTPTSSPEATQPITALDHYRLLGRSGLRVSPLCLGAMTFGTDWGWGADHDTSRAIFDTYAEAGGNFIDTANRYTEGTSEKYVGEFIASDRERFVVATKYTLSTQPGDPNAGGNQRKNMQQAVEASLRRLGTEYIDLYWVHAWDGVTPLEEVMRALDDLVRSGKVLYLGISDAPAWVIARANTIAELRGWTPFVALQINYSLAIRDAERDLNPMAEALGLGVTPWAPLAGGVLTGKYTREHIQREAPADRLASQDRPVTLTERRLEIAAAVVEVAQAIGRTPAQVAINWLLTRPAVVSPIFGARRIEQIRDNLGALDFTLAPEHVQRLDEVTAIELGFPHDFLKAEFVQSMLTGGTTLE